MATSTPRHILPVIIASGFAAAVAQIILLRELMVLFYGIELGMGAVLAAWLAWSALGCRLSAGFADRNSSKAPSPALLLILAAVVLPLTLLFIRVSSHLWGIVPGEIPPLFKLLQICLVATFPFSLLSGALFGLCWGNMQKTSPIPIAIYVGEASGAAAGGGLFYLFIVAHQSALTILLATSLFLLLVAVWFSGIDHKNGGRWKTRVPAGACIFMVLLGISVREKLDLASRRLQWGPEFVAATDTPYQNLIMVHKNRQYSVFANGLWLFSIPDPQSREFAVHPALLEHPAPKSVLLLGGVSAGLPEEILRHPSVRHIDAVEPDPALTGFSKAGFPKNLPFPETEGKVTLYYQDAGEFIRTHEGRYDVILMNIGDPINAQMNRFYTLSFFSVVKSRLAPKGIFSFGVSGGEDMLGEVQVEFLGSIFRTLSQTFAAVSVLPGGQVRFFASNTRDQLVENPALLSARIRQRGLHLSYVREDTLRDRFEAFRLHYFKSVLQDTRSDQVNKDFHPLCYAYALRLWTAQWHSWLGRAVASLTRIPPAVLWTVLVGVCLLFLGAFWAGRFRAGTAVCLSVTMVGALSMIVQMVLLITFQILAGALFLHLALIVVLFMAGLAGGAGWLSRKLHSGAAGPAHAGKLLLRVQTLILFFPSALAGLFLFIHSPLTSVIGSGIVIFLFSGLSLFSGILEGVHFTAATNTMAELGYPVSGIGGRLYAIDLVGAAGGLLIATFFLIPVLGPIQLLPMLSVAAGTSLLILYGRL